MPIPGPQPQIGGQEQVVVDGYPLSVVPGSYSRKPAPRFGDKISTGDLRYQDFNPYESAASYSVLTRGYGLRRFSDLPPGDDPQGFYLESNNVDCRESGICISPGLTNVTGLAVNPGAGCKVLALTEFTPSTGPYANITQWMVVFEVSVSPNNTISVSRFDAAGDCNLSSQNVITLTGRVALNSGIVLAANGQLIIGAGSQATAKYVTGADFNSGGTSVTDTATNPLYVYAITADRASIYIAGGAAATNKNTVLSAALTATNPAQSFATAASAVTCGDPNHAITALLPGGGIGGILVFVCKDNELGFIDTSAVYHTILPFGSTLATNGVGMRWWLPGSDATDVGQRLVFPVGRSIWSYDVMGNAQNMAPQGKEGFRPLNARGLVTAIQPTSHYLYYAVYNATQDKTWIIANDGVTGANHTYRYNGPAGCSVMGVTSLFGTNPLLYFEQNLTTTTGQSFMSYITLPADGDYPPAESSPNAGNCIYELAGNNVVAPFGQTTPIPIGNNILTLPDIDFGFPDEDKIATFLRVVGDNLVNGAQYFIVSYAADGASTYTTLGSFYTSPFQEVPFPSLTFKRLSLQIQFVTNMNTKTPILNAVSMRASINPKQYTLWAFQSPIPTAFTRIGSDAPYNSHTVISAFWSAYKAGTPVPYTDRWNKQWLVRILDFQEPETVEEQLRTPNSALSMTLLELYGTGLESAWDGGNTIFDDPNMTWG